MVILTVLGETPTARSGMRSDGQDRDLLLVRSVIPEDPPGSGSFVFGAGLEDFLAVRSFERTEFVGVGARMAGIGFQ